MSGLFKRRNEGIFQLSLTEIAFMLIFILLILLGMMYFNLVKEKEKLQLENQIIEQVVRQMNLKKDDPEALISHLKEMIKNQAEITALKQKLQDQEALLTRLTEVFGEQAVNSPEFKAKLLALAALDKTMNETANRLGIAESEMPNYLQQSLQLNQALQNAMNLPNDLLQKEREQILKETVQKLNDPNTKENLDLQGQVAYLRKRLASQGGRDLPPCWAGEDGSIEYLFRMDILRNGIKVTPVWSEKRAQDVAEIPNAQKLANQTFSRTQFQQLAYPIAEYSKMQQCRHYVMIKNHVSDIRTFNNYRYAIENVFYKLELR